MTREIRLKKLHQEKNNNLFTLFAERMADWLGRSWSFIASMVFVFAWLLLGPIWKFSDSWQLFINTMTSTITFLMVFIIQNTQNRNNKITRLMMDELIATLDKADKKLLDLDNLSDEELQKLEDKFKRFILTKKQR